MLEKILNTHKDEFPPIPDYIADNLAYPLRPYQQEAISKALYYFSDKPLYDFDKNLIDKQNHLLWQMATGSGKTLIMAALILEMYKRGQRNFWFFVNSVNIIIKSKDNFINSSSPKFQFAQKIEIDGRIVPIKQVETFDNTDNHAINIKLSTIHKLHQLISPDSTTENSISIDTFKDRDISVVMLADEAHHNNPTKAEKDEDNNWGNSVQEVLKANAKNYLFEFTATAGLDDPATKKIYEDKLLFDYALKKFREDGYSKDVFTNAISIDLDNDLEGIMLRAVLISQYRKHIAQEHKIALKPIILFKSKGTKDNKKPTEMSKQAFDKFNKMISNLSGAKIKKIFNAQKADDDSNILKKAAVYFCSKFKELDDLASELKMDFALDTNRVIIHDRSNERLVAGQDKLLNTLEQQDNPVRAIFAVNILNEGWDVLNLFDIVRLYDERDGEYKRGDSYKAGKTTISEAQLIGRGARYFPFEYQGEDKYRRKFDENETEPLRIIEQMHYHCKNDHRYISEIRHTLNKEGLIAGDEVVKISLKMKKDFTKTDLYNNGSVYVNGIYSKKDLKYDNQGRLGLMDENEIEPISKTNPKEDLPIPNYAQKNQAEIIFESGKSFTHEIFENENKIDLKSDLQDDETELKIISNKTLADLVPYNNIIRFAINSNKNLTFDRLKQAYPELKSLSEYIALLGKYPVLVKTYKDENSFSRDDLLKIANCVCREAETEVKQEQKRIKVKEYFVSKPYKDYFLEEVVRKYKKERDGEIGFSQNNPKNEKYQLDLSRYEWYVYNDNFGTAEEKSFVKWFHGFINTLKKAGWENIYLARNEGKLKLYSYLNNAHYAEGFEPDFVLCMRKNNIDYIFYIEPKGDHLLEKDDWKQEMLTAISKVEKKQEPTETKNKNWRLIGLPFYNEKHRADFEKAFKAELEIE
ncbi:MAG: DEAD/DEAH box helicase family protein [Elusimicrobiota bacterium]|nr:DEAD/DEAH box helicase family protein [Elusimicrobiota bacterium]